MKSNIEKSTTNKKNVLARTAAAVGLVAAMSAGVMASEAGASSAHNNKSVFPFKTEKNVPEPPFYNLVMDIINLNNGGQISVTEKPVNLPGEVNVATGNPIVIKESGKTYYAYFQSPGLSFDQKVGPAAIAEQMALIEAPKSQSHVKTEPAHLDKIGLLVDSNSMQVGFAIQTPGQKDPLKP